VPDQQLAAQRPANPPGFDPRFAPAECGNGQRQMKGLPGKPVSGGLEFSPDRAATIRRLGR
jgi:hypothetical protein